MKNLHSFNEYLNRASYFFKSQKSDIISIIVIFIILGLFFFPSFIAKDLTGDFITQEVPWYHFTYTNLKHGIIPFWSPYAFSGLPYLLKPELSIFNPITILTLFLSFIFNGNQSIETTGQIMEMVSIFCLMIGATGIYILARRFFYQSQLPALFASLAYTLNPFTIEQIHSTSVLHGVIILPWIIIALIKLLEKPSLKWFILLVLGNYMILSGYSYYYVYFFIMQFGLAIFYGFKKSVIFIISLFTSLFASGIFILSYLDIYLNSPRINNNLDIYFHSFASLSPAKLLEIINPITYSTNINPSDYTSIVGGPTLTWGSFAFIFLAYGFFALKKSPRFIWLIVVFFVSLFYSFGGNLQSHTFFGNMIPLIFKFRFHARALICTIFAGSLLIGLGVEKIKNQEKIKYIELFLWSFVLLIVAGIILAQIYLLHRISLNTEILKGTMIMLLFLISSLTVTALTIKYGKKSFLIVGLIVMLLEYNLFFQNFKYFFTNNITYGQFYKLNSLIPEIPTNNNLFRIYFEDNQFAYNTSMFNIYNMYGYENNPYKSSGERFIRYGMFRFYQFSNLKYFVTTTDNWQLGNPDVIKIRSINPSDHKTETFYQADDKTHYIYQIKNYLPRFYVPSRVENCNDTNCLLSENPPHLVMAKGILKNFDNPKKNVSIDVNEYSPNTIKLTIKTPGKTFIASSENFDKGWSIVINNHSSKIYDTSDGMRGFIVPSGKSIVEMTYFPPYLLIGSIISLLTILSIIIFWRINKRSTNFKNKNKRTIRIS